MKWSRVTDVYRTVLSGLDSNKAQRVEDNERLRPPAGLAEFIAEYSEPGPTKLLIGSVRTPNDEQPKIYLPTEDLVTDRMLVSGATGSGKSFWMQSLILQVLTSHSQVGIIVVDLKGELASWLTEIWLPLLADRMEASKREELLGRVVQINPFSEKYLPALQILKPDPNIPVRIQASELIDLFSSTVGEPGTRMTTILRHLLLLGISTGLTMVELPRILASEETRLKTVNRTNLNDVRDYFLYRFPKENKPAVQALESRLDAFLALPATRQVLSAPECIDFQKLLEESVTIINLGNPPLGSERTAKFWSSLLLGKLARAIISREITKKTTPLWVLIDEWQQALIPSQVHAFERLTTQVRYKRCGLALVNQGSEQLSGAPALRRIVETNIGLRVAFRAGSEDARSIAPSMLGRSRHGSEAARMRDAVHTLMHLPDRVFALSMRRKPFGPQLLVSPTIATPAKLAKKTNKVPEEIREAVLRGRYGRSIEEIEKAERGHQQDVEQEHVEDPHVASPPPDQSDIFGPFIG